LRSGGGLTSSTTSMFLSMTTASPSPGTRLFGHVAGSDQSDPCATAAWPPSRKQAVAYSVSSGVRELLGMAFIPAIDSKGSPTRSVSDVAREINSEATNLDTRMERF